MPPWSPYDASVPHPVGLEDAQQRFAALRERRGRPPDLAAVRDVVIVASSSRGGSTLFGELLRRCPGLLHLSAESNPHVVIAGLSGTGDTEVLVAELAHDLGAPAPSLDADATDRLVLDVAWRLTAQWPHLPITEESARTWVLGALADTDGWRGPPTQLALLARVAADHPEVHAGWYDVDGAPDAPPVLGPPGDLLVEMPPYVLPRPWRPATEAELANRTVVLATPRNSYRLGFLASLFPNARVRVLHLTRNPAASINGLIDGWLHHGFFNVAVDRPLCIAGYTDRFPGWGDRWWNYDVPPGWEDVVAATLPEVCALQWRTAHEAALAWVEDTGAELHRVAHEDLVGQRRDAALDALAPWLDVDRELLRAVAADGLPAVMATKPPAPRRWVERADSLQPVLGRDDVGSLAERLGYPLDPAAWT